MSEDLTGEIEKALFANNDQEIHTERPVPSQASEEEAEEGEEVEENAQVEGDDEEPEAEAKAQTTDDAEDETLASILGVGEDQIEFDDDGNAVFTAKVNGEEHQVPFTELVKSYQLNKHITQKSTTLSTKQREFQEMSTRASSEMLSKLQHMDKVSKLLERDLLADYRSVDWDDLSKSNPVEYARKRQEYTTKAGRLNKIKEQLELESSSVQEEQQKRAQTNYQEALKEEGEKLLLANPSWHDQKVREKEMGELRTFLNNEYGYTEQEIAAVSDSRLVRLIQDAHKYRSTKQAVETRAKKEVPSFQNTSSGRTKAAANARAAKAKKAALRKTGSQSALVDVLMDRI